MVLVSFIESILNLAIYVTINSVHYGKGRFVTFQGIILSYLKRSPMKMNPINVLIWIEQLNSLSLSINIIFGLVAINVDRPIRQMAGENFCKLIRLPGEDPQIAFILEIKNDEGAAAE